MIFLLLVILYLLIGALLVTKEFSDETRRKFFYDNLDMVSPNSRIPRKWLGRLSILMAILLWPICYILY